MLYVFFLLFEYVLYCMYIYISLQINTIFFVKLSKQTRRICTRSGGLVFPLEAKTYSRYSLVMTDGDRRGSLQHYLPLYTIDI